MIIWYITCFGCAILFYAIGAYARKLEKPMWFWSGTEVDPAKISDVKEYNRENSIMWKLYSLWYAAAGLAMIWSSAVAIALLVVGSTLGIFLLIFIYHKIYKKYEVR